MSTKSTGTTKSDETSNTSSSEYLVVLTGWPFSVLAIMIRYAGTLAIGHTMGKKRPKLSPIAPISSALRRALSNGAVISRRLWLSHPDVLRSKDRLLAREASAGGSSTKSHDAATSPWPINMVRAAYLSLSILVPYFSVWLVTSNPTLRDLLWPAADNNSRACRLIRNHFGAIDRDSESYPDVLQHGIDILDSRFPNEPCRIVRQQQRQIDWLLANGSITVNVSEVSAQPPETIIRSEISQLNYSVPTNELQLRSELAWDTRPDKSAAQDYTTTSIAVQFPESEAEISYQVTEDDPYISTQQVSPSDPLVRSVQSFSPWHYVNPSLLMIRQDQTAGTSMDSYQAEKSRLEFEINRLETELLNPIRPVDDLLDELNTNKAALRKLSWKRWLW